MELFFIGSPVVGPGGRARQILWFTKGQGTRCAFLPAHVWVLLVFLMAMSHWLSFSSAKSVLLTHCYVTSCTNLDTQKDVHALAHSFYGSEAWLRVMRDRNQVVSQLYPVHEGTLPGSWLLLEFSFLPLSFLFPTPLWFLYTWC
jgi:hypothetical protein